MKIEYISNAPFNNKKLDAKCTAYSKPFSLDSFDVCVVDVSCENTWNYSRGTLAPTYYSDFLSLKTSIQNSCKAKFLFVLPENIVFRKDYRYIYLKNDISSLKEQLSLILPNDISRKIDLCYETTVTEVNGNDFASDFYFKKNDLSTFNIITRSKESEKITTIVFGDRFFLTTLSCSNDKHKLSLIVEKLFGNGEEEIPQWVVEHAFYNDNEQKNIINEAEQKIKEANEAINTAHSILAKNNYFKSVLYSNGEQLVKVVFDILEKMLSIDLSSFEDLKKEDFLFKTEGMTFLGEIKGISSNVKNANVSQVNVHYMNYLDKLEEEGNSEEVYRLLIINHQRGKALENREQVHENQIKEAARENILIVETSTLLKMFENYLTGDLDRNGCLDLFKKTGLLYIQ